MKAQTNDFAFKIATVNRLIAPVVVLVSRPARALLEKCTTM